MSTPNTNQKKSFKFFSDDEYGWVSQRVAVFNLFHCKCVKCLSPAREINEIIPRSKGGTLDWRNQVPLCTRCHFEYHDDGVTQEDIQIMQDIRRTRLERFGKEKYI